MRVIKSVVTTDSILTYSNIPEDEYPVWVSGTSYTALDKVIYEHKIYERIVTGAGTTTPDLDQINWLDAGYTNRYRMFDNIISSVSSRTGGIEFTLTPNQIVNGIALLNVNASTVRVVMTDPVDGVVYDRTKELRSSSNVTDYFSYFFAPLVNLGDLDTAIFLDLPNKPTATITVYVSSGVGLVEVGEVVYGVQSIVGRTNYGTAIGIKSYSRKEADEFGKVTVIKRKNSKYADYDIDIDNTNLAFVQRLFQDIDSVPCVFIGNPEMEELIVYGFYSDFKATISFPTVSKCTLRVEGLI
jgi:hypothetical protein